MLGAATGAKAAHHAPSHCQAAGNLAAVVAPQKAVVLPRQLEIGIGIAIDPKPDALLMASRRGC
jgi:hypothetical protein